MREILFRGKRLDNGEWTYGYYYSDCDCSDRAHFIISPKADPDDSSRTYEVDPDTVGQYTGVTDRHGKEIFEGDILGFCSNARPVTVKWLPDEGKFMGVGNGCLDGINFKVWSIVGNIYDNPELMEVKDGKA